MPRTRYTAEQKAEALATYAEHGAAETARRTRIAEGTIKAWASRTGASLQRAETTAAATAAHVATAAERRARVTERLWHIADLASELELDLLRGADLRDVVGARTRAIHDAQLLGGDATQRTELRHVDALDAELERLTTELQGTE